MVPLTVAPWRTCILEEEETAFVMIYADALQGYYLHIKIKFSFVLPDITNITIIINKA